MEPGELVAARYRLVSRVGRGSMGVVWRARDERLDRVVAVKELLADDSTEDAAARALREGRIASRLRHPNAIAVHDVVTHEGTPCLVMEYLPAERLAAHGALPAAEVARVGAQVAGALAAAHAAGIVHRDVKPENVLIAEDGTAKITDFGISRAAGLGTVTATGILAGTPAYLAPEVAGGADADVRSDVFSLGATLYAAVEGVPPFGLDDNPIALLHRVAAGAMRPPELAGPLTETLLWLLRRDPAERPTMAAAHEALAAAAAGRPVPVPAPPTPTLMLPARRVPRRAIVLGVSAAVLVAVGIVLGALLDDQESTGATGTTSTTPPTTTTRAAPACLASYKVTGSWPDGHQAEVTVRNDGTRALTGWAVRWTLPDGQKINNLWNGVVERDGAAVTVTNADWNVTVPAGGSTSFGLTVDTPKDDDRTPNPTCESQ